jgi:hypothetical protein
VTTVDDITHGISGYRKGCRCDVCKTANYQAQKQWRDNITSMPESAHGTVNGYKIYGCRCDDCKAANSEANDRRRRRKERLRKLAAAGLPSDYEGEI